MVLVNEMIRTLTQIPKRTPPAIEIAMAAGMDNDVVRI